MSIKYPKNLERLVEESKSLIPDNELIKLIKKKHNSNFIGLIDSSENIKNIKIARKFLKPSSFYGHMYGKNISTAWNIRPSEGMDVFETDSNGILKNAINSEDAISRVHEAKKNNTPIIYVFGGSTVMSLGSRVPSFSIPSLIEKISKEIYQKEIICVNFGLGGTSSQEALNLMIYKAFKLAKPTSVIFYDGWNCASYLTKMNLLKKDIIKDQKIVYFDGDNVRNVEHNITLNSSYDLFWMLSRTFKLTLANLFSIFSRLFRFKIIYKVLNIIQERYFKLNTSNINNDIQKKLNDCNKDEIKNMMSNIITEYIDVHKYAYEICKSQKVNFYWMFQPLVFYGKKKLNNKETIWKKNGLSSIHPKFYEIFYEEFSNRVKLFGEIKSNFSDLSGVFDDIEEQTYIDSGHLNRFGNLIVANRISNIIFKNDDKKNI